MIWYSYKRIMKNVFNWSYICCRVDLVHSQPKMSSFNLHKLLHTSSMMWKMMMKNSTGRGFYSQPLAATFIIIHYHGNYNSIIVRAHQFFFNFESCGLRVCIMFVWKKGYVWMTLISKELSYAYIWINCYIN